MDSQTPDWFANADLSKAERVFQPAFATATCTDTQARSTSPNQVLAPISCGELLVITLAALPLVGIALVPLVRYEPIPGAQCAGAIFALNSNMLLSNQSAAFLIELPQLV